jgi:hypothetical protein
MDEYVRMIAPGAAERVWIARIDRFEIGKWTPDGEEEGRLVRRGMALPEGLRAKSLLNPDLSRQTISGLWEAPEGILWVVSTVSERQAPQNPADREPPADSNPSSLVAVPTIIEVFDSRTGVLIASRSIDGLHIPVQGGAMLFTRSPDNSVDVWRLCFGGS